jgi:uncharacterized protein
MRIAVTGATGFIGRRLTASLGADGIGSRAVPRGTPGAELEGADAVVHLAGEPVAQRWTPEAKRRIRDSRVQGTGLLVEALAALPRRPEVLVAASAVGYYGSRGDEILSEGAAPGKGFLPEVCVEWEKAADAASALGIRVVKVRIGMVLGSGGGALAQMLPPFRMGVGGPLAGGQQWMSWIHIEDLVRLIRFAVETPALRGALNGTSPNPVRNADFTQKLARAVHRPAFFPVPKFALELLYGEMSEVLLGSQRVVPRLAEDAGFGFRYPEAEAALRQILG